MRIINIIMLLLILSATISHAQDKSQSSNHTRTIEINNDKGDLHISFVNGVIKEFTVNDNDVPEDRFEDYQNILDEFVGEEVQTFTPPQPPAPPAPPVPPVVNEDHQNEQLRTSITSYLIDEGIINSSKKIKVQLKSKFLKVNGKSQSQQTHQDCLDLFEDIYGHGLNTKSEVKFKKSRKNSSLSVRIVK